MDGKTVCGCLAPPSTFLLSTFPHVHNFQMNHVLKTPAGRVLVNFFSLSALLPLLYLGLGLASCIDWSRSYTNWQDFSPVCREQLSIIFFPSQNLGLLWAPQLQLFNQLFNRPKIGTNIINQFWNHYKINLWFSIYKKSNLSNFRQLQTSRIKDILDYDTCMYD